MRTENSKTLAGKRILIVEDERLVALHTRDLLQAWGCAVLGPAGTVSEAMSLIESEAPDAALLDVRLDEETSEPVAEVLAAMRRPFLVITAYGVQHVPAGMREAPMLGKPVTAPRLKQALCDLFAE